MNKLGIRTRLIMLALLPMLLVALVLGYFFTHSQLEEIDSAWRKLARAETRHLASSSEYALATGNTQLLRHLVDEAGREPGIRFLVVMDENGRVLSEIGDVPALFKAPSHESDETNWEGGSIFSAAVSLKTFPIEDEFFKSRVKDASEQPLGSVHIGVSDEAVRAAQRKMLLTGTAITLVGLLMAAALALVLSRTISQPIRKLSKVVSEVRKGNLRARVTVDAVGEFLALQQGFNAMADTLQNAQADLQQRILEATAELSAKKEEAEQANRDKSRFLATVSHDLRQPMHALGLFAAALRQRVRIPEQVALLRKIEDSVSALKEMFDGLLNLSRLDAGAIQPDLTTVELAPLFRRLEERFQPMAVEKGLRLRFRNDGLWVIGDPMLFERMLSNLVENAIRYTDHGGVLVSCRRRKTGAVKLQVWDTGIGIAREHLSHLFEEYYQVDNPARNRAQGMGLGLAIVGRIAKLLGLDVDVNSRPGHGTVFGIALPQAKPGERGERRSAAQREIGSFSGQCVLVIDDDGSVRESMHDLLSSWDLRPVVTASANGALVLLEDVRNAPDMLLCDYRLPGGSGIDTVKEVCTSLGRNIPAILISGDTAPESQADMQTSGLPILRKPVRPAKLRAMMSGLFCGAASVRGENRNDR
jgi:two-component system, sensor histidine kinase